MDAAPVGVRCVKVGGGFGGRSAFSVTALRRASNPLARLEDGLTRLANVADLAFRVQLGK